MKLDEALKLSANVRIIVEEDGEVVDVIERHNLVVAVGRGLVASFLAGDAPAYPDYVAVGTGSTAVQSTDTALGTEVLRTQVTKSTAGSTSVTFSHYLSTSEANGNTLAEAGLFNASSGASMFARVTHDGIAKTSSVAITYVWEISIAAAEG